jgi:hypothetical protein
MNERKNGRKLVDANCDKWERKIPIESGGSKSELTKKTDRKWRIGKSR